MAQIKEDYVSYETAKLLKEKGFNIPYDSFRGVYINGKFKRLNPGDVFGYDSGDEIVEVCSLQMAMKWLKEVHKLYVFSIPYMNEDGIFYTYEIKRLHEYMIEGVSTKTCFKSSEQACEAAIKYCLENLV